MAIRKTIQDGNISVQDFSTIKVHTSICNDCIVKDFGIIKLFLITRTFAALRAADLDWIVGPVYSFVVCSQPTKPWKPTKNHETTLKNYWNQPKTMKPPWKTMETNQKPWKNHETTLKTM